MRDDTTSSYTATITVDRAPADAFTAIIDVAFDIGPTSSGSEVRFHVGLAPEHECFDVCSSAWAAHLT